MVATYEWSFTTAFAPGTSDIKGKERKDDSAAKEATTTPLTTKKEKEEGGKEKEDILEYEKQDEK